MAKGTYGEVRIGRYRRFKADTNREVAVKMLDLDKNDEREDSMRSSPSPKWRGSGIAKTA